ncbi:hypothetical protein M407DRAFT_31619 [Tulasnella calospora MUT 4182]|uniref:F-box domain-containing protein n=1 Tax=Tulasnella calospora MUT 4182 TaxID=1051891 RepID=A0A0C3Q5A9_9AGAM|nr:hypothetical protein M407DRAFT_31619 [Tulasnella calospora MUT 4182]
MSDLNTLKKGPTIIEQSICLFETFLLQPDLALLVRHLGINLSWRDSELFPESQIPSVLQPDGLVVLSLAKNLNSLSLAGVASWIWEPEMAKLREAMFKMKLVRLQVPFLYDPHIEEACVWPGDEVDWDGDLSDEIRKLLQAQPLLEEFRLSDPSISYKTSASLRLKHADVPRLKSSQATPLLAMAFFLVADRLERLNLVIDTDWDDGFLSDMETKSASIKPFVRYFTIQVQYSDQWLWNNLVKIFALFPKTEELLVAINHVEPVKHFFEKVGTNIYALPSIRHFEVQFQTRYPETPKILEVGKHSLVEYKTACPTLETVVDPAKRLWTFRYNHQGSGDFEPWLVGPLIRERLEQGRTFQPQKEATHNFEPEQVIDQPAQLQNRNVLDLPNELLLRVVSLLPTTSIPNLMVNRSLQSVCEQGLYRYISLPRHPRRSIRLLETFLLRPDLALLVHHLEINFSWRYPGLFLPSQIPSVLHPDGLEALCLAQNLQSLSLAGVADWIWEPDMAKFREAIFKMKLVRLEVPVIDDPHNEYECVIYEDSDGEEQAAGGEGNWGGDLGNEIRNLLQAQPLLEEFKLSDSQISDTTVESLQATLKTSDVPRLKSLQAVPEVAMAFLQVAPQLESLDLMIRDWDNTLLSEMENNSATIKLSIRRFTIRVRYSDKWLWNNLAMVFSLFPGTEELSVTINSLTTREGVEPANYFFRKVRDSVYVLPSLRSLEVKFETPYPQTPGTREVEIQPMIDCKAACPMLETVVDPERRLWTFRPDGQVLAGFVAHLVGPLMEERLNLGKDLSAPEEAIHRGV